MPNRRDVTDQSVPDQAAANTAYNTEMAKRQQEDPATRLREALQGMVDAAGTLRINQGPSGEPEAVRWNLALDKAKAALNG